MRWRCIRGSSGCYYYYYGYYWNTHVVNSTSFSVNVTSYGTAYEFEITVITSHGRGSPSKLTKYVPPLNGIPRDFSCQVAVDNSVITCHWSPPTDFNPAGFYVSSNMRNAALMFWVVHWERTRFSQWHRRLGRNRDLKVQRCVLSVFIAIIRTRLLCQI